MMKKVSPKQLSFKMVAIEMVESILNQPHIQILEENIFQFDISSEQRIHAAEGHIIVICTITILNNIRDQQLARIKSSCIFAVNDLVRYTDKKTDTINIPEDFRVNLNSIAISTSRGILYSFLRGTYLHNAILPIVNPSSFQLNKPE